MSSVLLDYHPRRPVDDEASLPLRRRKPWLALSRWPIILGCAIVAVTAFLPWVTTRWDSFGVLQTDVHTGANTGDTPGLLAGIFAMTCLLLGALPAVANSTTRTVQLSPAILGVVCLLQSAYGYQVMSFSIGLPGSTVEPGLWLFMLGATLVAFGGVVVSVLIIRDNRVVAEALPLRSFAWVLWVTVSGAAGIALSILLALAIFGTNPETVIFPWGWVALTAPILGTLVYELKILLPRRFARG